MNKNTCNKTVEFCRSDAQTIRHLRLNADVELIQYRNSNERVHYQREDIHTFSMYQAGGHNTYQLNKTDKKGGPGLFCLMPRGSYSDWQIGCKQSFTHLQFTDNHLKRLALQTFDLDPRCLSLPQLTFEDNPKLRAIFHHFITLPQWQDTTIRVALEQAISLLLAQLITDYHSTFTDPAVLKGGLAPAIKNRVIDYINAHLSENIPLSRLAGVAELSEYHFCRMFKQSMGESPHKFILRRKLESVKDALENQPQTSLADIALSYGFSHQSHMGRVFKQYYSLTPKQFRQLATNGNV